MDFDHVNLEQLERELIALRRDFHKHPESGWTEFRTTARIIGELEKLGLTVQYGPSIHVKEKMFGLPKPEVLEACWQRAMDETGRPDLVEAMRGGYTGCLTVIEGALPGPTVGIRVDIDCNDVEEADDPRHLPCAQGFRSTHEKCMHACGHDAHAAIGVGVAKLLCACRDQLRGKVLLVFQPGEEGLRGAASLTAAGHFSACDYFFGGHVGLLDGLSVGDIAAGGHGFLASTKFDAMFHGVPSHAGAAPELGHNAVAAAAVATLGMLSISRHHEGASRINVGTFHGGTGRNVIPAEAELTIETRGSTTQINEYMEAEARRVCQAAADMYGCTLETRFMGSAGCIVCDEPLVEHTVELLSRTQGVNRILRDIDFGGGEDVTTMMRDVQEHGGQVIELVFGMPLPAPHHNNYFDVAEPVIPLAARILAALALTAGDWTEN